MHKARFIYVYDPMCSWCWGHRPQWEQLEAALRELVSVEYCLGGLAADCDGPISWQQQQTIMACWRKINGLLGTEFNFAFWINNVPLRSNWPACRATLAARWQNAERKMILAVQEVFYLRAMNPSDTAAHGKLAAELGLVMNKFNKDRALVELIQALHTEIEFSRSLPIRGFPSMVLWFQQVAYPVELDYQDHRRALAQVKEILLT